MPKSIRGKPLTRRERQVLDCIAHGLTNKEIACALGVAEQTVKNHVEMILNKLGAKNRTAAAVMYTARLHFYDRLAEKVRSIFRTDT